LEVINGQAQVVSINRMATRHTYRIIAKTKASVRENTVYFPGWNVYVDNTKILLSPVTYTSGIIHFDLQTGDHQIAVVFEDTSDRKAGKIVSIIAMISLFGVNLVYKRKSVSKNQ
jgi:hypothetical protein